MKDDASTASDDSDVDVLPSEQRWRWGKPVFIMLVSLVTLLDQLISIWLLFEYARKGACRSPSFP